MGTQMHKNKYLTASLRQPQGFSMAELTIVVVMMGVMAAVAVLGMAKSINDACLQKAADRLMADLRQVRNKAILEQKTYRINFSPSSRTYTAPGVSASDSRNGNDISVNLADDNYRITQMSCVLAMGKTYIDFDARGYADPSGEISLRSGDIVIRIKVSPEGQIEQQK